MNLHDFALGLVIGLVGGGFSGLLGVSSGGFLVALAVLIMGLPQHVAQGVSLVAQVPPTSLSGVMHYRKSGHTVPMRWIVLASVAFILGAIGGAIGAGFIAGSILRW